MFFSLLFILFPLSVICLNFTADEVKNEGTLYENLLTDYNPLVRPVENSSAAVVVHIGIVLQQIVDVDEKHQVVDLNAWVKLTWNDYQLTWDPEDYGGVKDLRFKKSQVWTPDVLMYNSADPHFDSSYPSNVVVYPDGHVLWIPPGIFRISCSIQVAWFPFDVQQCFLKYGSWTHDGAKVELEVDVNGLDTSNYLPNGEWTLEGTSAVRNIQFYQCCPEPYHDVVFSFVIRRRALYYTFNLILPCALIAMLTLVGFTFPPEAGEKMSLQISLMLSICIFQNYVTDISPPTSEAVPFLGVYFAVCLVTSGCCVTATTLAINFYHRTGRSHSMSRTFKTVMLDWVPWILCMKRPGFIAQDGKMIEELSEDDFDNEQVKMEDRKRIEQLITQIISKCSAKFRGSSEKTHTAKTHLWWNASCRPPHAFLNVHPVQIAQILSLQQIFFHVSAINQDIQTKEKYKRVENEWKYSAQVVDRICMYVFTIFHIVSTFLLFWSVPELGRSF